MMKNENLDRITPQPRDKKLNAHALLLAGGSGTRLWPVSRALKPKQLIRFMGKDSLLQSTIKRLAPMVDPEKIRIVCGKEHFHETALHVEEMGITAEGKVISEPCGRNTATAILLGLFKVIENESDAVVCVFPADHAIKNIDGFHRKLKSAVRLAGLGYIVTFGITPDYPETGYGYIEGGKDISEGAFLVKRFVEKPDEKTAQKYVESGNYFWNSGMFVFKASVMLDEFKTFQPTLFNSMKNLIEAPGALTRKAYGQLPDISIDYAIMEKSDKVAVLPADFGWSDIGSWKSLYDFFIKDNHNNVVKGDVITKDTENCLIMGQKRLVVVNGLKNIVVVETPDCVFISDIENSRNVKSIVTEIKQAGRAEY